MKARHALERYVDGVRAGDRALLAQAITLVESREGSDRLLAERLVGKLLPFAGQARRIGVTGVPGVGKSTFIDELGTYLTTKGHRVAVLAIDPSSALSGGSILGDKTRMQRLAVDPNAFIRPSPSALTPGGVARRTRETLLLCEVAGFDVVIVETVGVGQGETAVADMVDFFLVLALPGSGDELQGIKKGVIELADAIAVNKADGDGADRARLALGDFRAVLRYLPRKRASWRPEALAISGLTGAGIDELWSVVERHRETLSASGELATLRAEQQRAWMWGLIAEGLDHAFRGHPGVVARLAEVEAAVLAGETSPTAAATSLLETFGLPRDR